MFSFNVGEGLLVCSVQICSPDEQAALENVRPTGRVSARHDRGHLDLGFGKVLI